MFKEHDVNEQQSIFNAANWMDPRTQRILQESWAPVIHDHVYTKIDERKYSVLYDQQQGAPNFPVRILLTLELIQHMLDISDDEMYGMYNFDYRVSYALGQMALGEKPLAERTRYYFRERLYTYTMTHPEEEDLIFQQFKELTEAMCINAGIAMNEQRIDSTMFMSNIKKSGRISLAYDVLVKGARKIPEAEQTETVKKILLPSFRQEVIYKAKSSETGSKLTKLLQYCQEIETLLESLTGVDVTDEIRIIKRLLSEHADTDETGQITAKNGKLVSPKSMQSAYDEDATYRKKGEKKQSGYVAGITETCSDENEVQFITDYTIEPNVVSDVEILTERLEPISQTDCEKLYSDGGFYSGVMIDAALENGIEMQYTGMTGHSNATDKLTANDFEFNETNDVIRQCPAGYAPLHNSPSSANICAHFDKVLCEGCAFRDCCLAKPLKNTFVVRLSKETVIASKQREELAEHFQGNTCKRAAIEGTNSALKRKGMAKLRVRGIHKCRIVCGYKILAQNISRYIKFTQGFYAKEAHAAQGRIVPSYAQ